LNLDYKQSENEEDFDISACKNNLESLDSNHNNSNNDYGSPRFKMQSESSKKNMNIDITPNSKSYIPKLDISK